MAERDSSSRITEIAVGRITRRGFLKRGAMVLVAAEVAEKAFQSPVVEAANCSGRAGIRFESAEGIDMFPIDGKGRPNKVDRGIDPEVSPAVGFNMEVLDKPAKDGGKVIASTAIISDGKLGRGDVSFPQNCATTGPDGQPATLVYVRSSQNPSDEESVIIPTDPKQNREVHMVGRIIKGDDNIERAAKTLSDNDPRRKEIEDYLRAKKIGSPTPTVTPSATARPIATSTPAPTATSTPGPVVGDGNVRVQGVKEGDPVKIQKAEEFLWLPASILGAGALVSLGLLLRRDRMIEIHHGEGYYPGEVGPHDHEHTHTIGPAEPVTGPQAPITPRPTAPAAAVAAAPTIRAQRPAPTEQAVRVIREKKPTRGNVTRYDLIATLDDGRPVQAMVTAAGEQVVDVDLVDAPRYQTRILGGFRRFSDSGRVKKVVQKALYLGELDSEPVVQPAGEPQPQTVDTQVELQAVVEGLSKLAQRTQTLAGTVTRSNRAIQARFDRLQQPTQQPTPQQTRGRRVRGGNNPQ